MTTCWEDPSAQNLLKPGSAEIQGRGKFGSGMPEGRSEKAGQRDAGGHTLSLAKWLTGGHTAQPELEFRIPFPNCTISSILSLREYGAKSQRPLRRKVCPAGMALGTLSQVLPRVAGNVQGHRFVQEIWAFPPGREAQALTQARMRNTLWGRDSC